MNTFGDRIRKLRTNIKLKQRQLGDLVGVSTQVISNWERGYSSPDNEDMAKLAEILKTSTDYLLGRVEDIFSDQLDMATRLDIIADQEQELGSSLQKGYVTFDLIKLLSSSYGIVVKDQLLSHLERELLIKTIINEIESVKSIKQNLLDQVENETDVCFIMGAEGRIIRM
ncbi:helix-turn-helix domain-containing protein [Paenibacillus sp. sgz500958]|uniref:helix-turn-helix domain-containing protein n=1 Tax=Paenibacillus sp. sgz500958 TaxID=3242475 RepID=UPI0036D24BBC